MLLKKELPGLVSIAINGLSSLDPRVTKVDLMLAPVAGSIRLTATPDPDAPTRLDQKRRPWPSNWRSASSPRVDPSGGLKNTGGVKVAPALVVRRTPSADDSARFPGSMLLSASTGSTGVPLRTLIAPSGTSGRFAGIT